MGFKLGNLEIKNGIILAPMAGYSDRAMRKICRDCGAELSFTEMVSAKAVTFGDKKTELIAGIKPDEGTVALQIFGSEPEVMAQAAAALQKGREAAGYCAPVAIDINMGCPVNKIYGNGEGSALMKNPELIEKIVEAVKSAVNIPVSVKIRSGVDREHINAVECALAAEAGGAELLTVHGRTRTQMYGGEADYGIIRAVKQALKIPVIANGDINSAGKAAEAFELCGCDGIMIGRAAVGNPFIFAELKAYFEGGNYTPPTLEQRIKMALAQLELAVIDKGERVAVPEARKQIALYFKGERGSAALRAKINTALTFREVEAAIYQSLE